MNGEILELLKQFRLELKKDMEEVGLKMVQEIKEHVNSIDNSMKLVQNKIKYFDREIKKRNLVLFGINQEFSNYWELESFVCEFFKEKLELNIAANEFDFVKRLGKRNNENGRPILLGMTTFRTKLLIIQNAFKLKGTKVFISEDYPKEVIELRKKLQPQLTEARKAGKFATLRYDKLIIKDNYQVMNKKRLMSISPPSEKEKQKGGLDDNSVKKNRLEDGKSPSLNSPIFTARTSAITNQAAQIGKVDGASHTKT